ncbi:MAG: antitoxin family protein [Bryobacteraceae bacterium]
MQKTFEAVYENGVLRPLAPLALANAQRVQVTIADVDSDVAAYFDPGEWEASKHDDISLQEVRAALSSIEGSLSDAVLASREERF